MSPACGTGGGGARCGRELDSFEAVASAIVHPIVWIDRCGGRRTDEDGRVSAAECGPECAPRIRVRVGVGGSARGPSGAAVSDAVGGFGLVVSNNARYAGPAGRVMSVTPSFYITLVRNRYLVGFVDVLFGLVW